MNHNINYLHLYFSTDRPTLEEKYYEDKSLSGSVAFKHLCHTILSQTITLVVVLLLLDIKIFL